MGQLQPGINPFFGINLRHATSQLLEQLASPRSELLLIEPLASTK